MLRAARAASTVVGSTTLGSVRAVSAMGSVYMKPAGGAATISQVWLAGLNM
jgi:hypothetical protein